MTVKKQLETYVPFSPPWIDTEEKTEVLEALESGWITTGPKTKEFEKGVAAYSGARQAVAASSCTAALTVALRTLNVQEGDEVITTPYTFVATGHVICYQKATPVFVDVEEDTFNMDPRKIESRISSKTKMVLPVHYGGHACDMDPILDIARKYKLRVVEDAAHAIGTEYKGRKIGSIGDITCFSFYATKNLTTAEGGMALTDNEAWAERMRILTIYGISDARDIWHLRYSNQPSPIHYDVLELGYKCNMPDICAAIGIHQLRKLDGFNQTREKFARIYDAAFEGHSGIVVPKIKPYTKSSRHLYPLRLNLDFLKIDRDTFVHKLKERRIGTSVLFKPLHLHSYYAKTFGYRAGDFPVAEKLFREVICLPISPVLGESAISRVAETVLELVEEYRR